MLGCLAPVPKMILAEFQQPLRIGSSKNDIRSKIHQDQEGHTAGILTAINTGQRDMFNNAGFCLFHDVFMLTHWVQGYPIFRQTYIGLLPFGFQRQRYFFRTRNSSILSPESRPSKHTFYFFWNGPMKIDGNALKFGGFLE